MPMQPRPRAETVRPLRPNWRVSMTNPPKDFTFRKAGVSFYSRNRGHLVFFACFPSQALNRFVRQCAQDYHSKTTLLQLGTAIGDEAPTTALRWQILADGQHAESLRSATVPNLLK